MSSSLPSSQNRAPLRDVLALEEISPDRFRAHLHHANHRGGAFGGSLLAQALYAAELSTPGRRPHAMHAAFLRSAATKDPIDFLTERTRDGGSISARRVTAWQSDLLVFEAQVSLFVPEPGFAHARPWESPPPPPASVASLTEIAETWGDRIPEEQRTLIREFESGIEARVIDPETILLHKSAPAARLWVRPKPHPGPAPASGYAVLAFLSDYLMPAACNLPHTRSVFANGLMSASLNHAMWFHAPCPPGEWVFYEIESPWAGDARGLSFGRMYAEDGRLLAHACQEQLVRAAF